jgi:hypothetical protein
MVERRFFRGFDKLTEEVDKIFNDCYGKGLRLSELYLKVSAETLG